MDMTIASSILLVLMLIYGVGFHASLILYVALVALRALTAAAVGGRRRSTLNIAMFAMPCHSRFKS